MTNEELTELYKKLTPENKDKFVLKYCELLREQRAQEEEAKK